MLGRFKRAIRYRKWAILLFPLVGPLGVITASALNDSAVSVTSMVIHYVGIAIGVITFAMIKDDYKELND